MPEITVTTTVTFDPQRWAEDAMYIPGVWMIEALPTDEGVTYRWFDEETSEDRSEFVFYSRIGWAMGHLAGGTYTNYNGDEVRLNAYQARAAHDLVHDYDAADFDAETDDLIAQMATFGKIIYG